MKIAIITGASSGMGREFARQFTAAEKFDALWVIARRADRLESLAEELNLPLKILALDLCDPACLKEYAAALEAEKPEVSLLINASGFGRFERSDRIALEDQMGMIDLNCRALVAVTHLTLPYMQAGSRILQVGSLSSFQPVPYLNVYAASKAFVLSYSQALGRELKPRKIQVMAVCPGWVKTEFFNRAEQSEQQIVTYFNHWFTAEEVVTYARKCLKKGKSVCVPCWKNRLQVLAVKLLPAKLVMNTWLRQQKLK